jgi:arginine N-succinyltransferase
VTFLLRSARVSDLDAILELAKHLDSPNLPHDEPFVRRRLERAERSFQAPGPPHAEREYQFALVDEADRVIGTCAVLSKHGTPEMPHLYLRVGEETRYSPSTGVRVTHTTLQLGASRDGPTELGSLVLRPDVRHRPGWPGKLLSWGRFAYIARHRHSFEPRILAEMRAAIDAHGRSAFWDAFGKRFTGMSYAEADHLSAVDKSFVLDLFPDTPFYASLLDAGVSAELGQVHEDTVPALRLLEAAGLAWGDEIDPFDGGPFVGAETAKVMPIRETARGVLADGAPPEGSPAAIVATEERGAFRAVAAPVARAGAEVHIGKEARERLDLATGEEVSVTPLPRTRSKAAGHG